MIYLRLFFEFFKAGLFAIGGGLATLPFIYDMSDRLEWITAAEIADMIAVSETVPGPFGANMSVYTGYLTGGAGGAIASVLGLIAPSVIVILIVSMVLDKFRNSSGTEAAFYGLRPASAALISSVCLLLIIQALTIPPEYRAANRISDMFEWKYVFFAGFILLLTNMRHIKKLHPVFFIAFSAVVGIVFGRMGI
ncbi:MAG: chromate transporter [Oscillospiraceae bacterium]|nr:chromate transporter [Oscillospiraceae bacterium]